ncbi:MAG: IS91 family transposase [Solirubrobacteraceae bacterium]
MRAARRPALEVADIVRAHGQAFVRAHALTPDQHAVLRDIARCRTAALGGYAQVCDTCGHTEVAYNSCRNRHCPKCQSLSQARWIEQRMQRVLPTHAFHVVFTLPSQLHALVMANRDKLFDLLFASAADSLLELGRDPRWLGAELGITSVLHTWSRELRFHPHVHCIVTGGGLSLDGQRWIATRQDFLLPVRVLGALFRGKFLARLVRLYERGELRLTGCAASLTDAARFARLRDKLHRVRWVVFVKQPFGGPEQVFRYLGRYTHRVGLSNRRLVSLDERGVTFRTRGEQKVTVAPAEFLRRFLLHVLPKGYVKIRHHGLMAASHVPTRLATARRLLDHDPHTTGNDNGGARAPRDFRELLLALTGIDLRRCPRCGVGLMIRQPLPAPASGPTPIAPDTS